MSDIRNFGPRISRRRVLAGSVIAGTGLLLPASRALAGTPASTTAQPVYDSPTDQAFAQRLSSLGATYIPGPVLGPDGMAGNWVQGNVTEIAGSTLTVVGAQNQTATVSVPSSCPVYARGTVMSGSLAAVAVGDRVGIGSSYDAILRRFARYVLVNRIVISGSLLSVNSTAMVIADARSGIEYTILNVPALVAAWPTPDSVGSNVWCSATGSSPQNGSGVTWWAIKVSVSLSVIQGPPPGLVSGRMLGGKRTA
jgi:hypothetical protein